MENMLPLSFVLLLFCTGVSSTICSGDSFLNVCGYCVGGGTGIDVSEGLDRCDICGGQSNCVGCDGVVNSPLRKDMCGDCQLPDSLTWNDCVTINDVYPSTIDRALGNNVVLLILYGAGLRANDPMLKDISCHANPLFNQLTRPTILATGMDDTDIELKVQIGSGLGPYAISCDNIQGQSVVNIVDSTAWRTIKVEPPVLTVDLTYQLRLEVRGELIGQRMVWCFIRCTGLPAQIMTSVWISNNSVLCHDFTPRTAANCDVGVVATEVAGELPDSTGPSSKLTVRGTAPHILTAEYSHDFGQLLIRFNTNIKLTKGCNAVFSEVSLLSLNSSECLTSGDILHVALYPDHPLIPSVEIIEKNGIYRLRSDTQLSPECSPAIVPVSAKEVLPPNLSLQIPSLLCHSNDQLRITSIGRQRLTYKWIVPPPDIAPGSQRYNLILWKKSRDIEHELNGAQSDSGSISTTELLPGKEYNIEVRGTDALGREQTVRSSLIFSPTARATVVVAAQPAVRALLAEVNLTLCSNVPEGLSFHWYLNDELMVGGGRLMLMSDLNPGNYNVTCVVSVYETGEHVASVAQSVIGTNVSLPIPEQIEINTKTTKFLEQHITGFGTSSSTDELSFSRYLLTTNHVTGNIDVAHRRTYITYCLISYNQSNGVEPIHIYGWVLTQVLPSYEKALLSPAEQVVSTMDAVTIEAFTTYGIEGVWKCKTDADLPCFSPGPARQLVEDLIVNVEKILKILPGTLAVGRYSWFLNNIPSTTAVVIVRPGLPPLAKVSIIPPLANPYLPLELNGEGHRLHADCSLRWSTVMQLGFNYFNLQEDVGIGDRLRIIPENDETVTLPLTVPTAQGHWKGLMAEASYLLRFIASCPDTGTGHADVPVTVNVPPVVSPLKITPTAGLALTTTFYVHGGEAYDVFMDYPLRYSWSIRDETNSKIVLEMGASPRTLSLMLPIGKITFILDVCDVHSTCSTVESETVTVVPPISVSEDVISDLKRDVFNLILEGSGLQGLGKSIVAMQTLRKLQDNTSMKQFDDIAGATELAIIKRVDDLRRGIGTNPMVAVSGLEFLQQLLVSISYFPPDKSILKPLMDLKESIADTANHRRKREAPDMNMRPTNVEISVIEAAQVSFDVDSHVFKQNPSDTARNQLLQDVREYAGKLCQKERNSASLIKSELVELWVSTRLVRNDFRSFQPSGFKDWVQVLLNERMTTPLSTCLAIAKYHRDLFYSLKINMVSNVYDIRLIHMSGEVYTQTAKDPSHEVLIPLIDKPKSLDASCLVWRNVGDKINNIMQSEKEEGLSCKARNFGLYLAVVPGSPTTTIATTSSTTRMPIRTTFTTRLPTTAITPTTVASTTTVKLVVTSTEKPTTVSERTTILPTTQLVYTTSPGKDQINEIKTSYAGGMFMMDEDFNKTVGVNAHKFEYHLTSQISGKLNVTEEEIFVKVRKGSVVVTVYFLVSMERTTAHAVITELSQLVRAGDLKLYGLENQPLKIPEQNLTLIVPPYESKAGTFRTATIVVAAVGVAFILLMTLSAFRDCRRPQFHPRIRQEEFSVPRYAEFDCDISMEGSTKNISDLQNSYFQTHRRAL